MPGRRLVAPLAAAALATVAVLCGDDQAHARACRTLPSSPSTVAIPPAGPMPPPPGATITVPVHVHYMKSTEPRHASANDLRRVFPERFIDTLFGDSPRDTVNVIFRQAKIRLRLYHVEECEYDPAAFDVEIGAREDMPSPMSGDFGRRVFNRVNATFNATAPPGVDVYLWMDVRAGLVGFGASHRRSAPRRVGAVWVDRGCLETLSPARCTVLVAHEIGHFLGLCHSCETAMTNSGSCAVCLPPGAVTAPACGPRENLLMRPWFDGLGLTPCEIGQARLRAAERVNTR